jgi:hypothetical protein
VKSLKAKTNNFVVLIVIALLAVGIATPANAYTLTITSTNLNKLVGFPASAYSSGKLLYTYGRGLDVVCPILNSNGYTKLYDNKGSGTCLYPGQCVSACKALARNSAATSQWKRGAKVVNGGISRGTVIATFSGSGGTFASGSDHCAIFKGSLSNGIEVWDQNWYAYLMGMHTISKSGSSVVTNANNYYVVTI